MSQNNIEQYQFYRIKLALENGAAGAKIISTDKVIVENRVTLKCRNCNYYGKTLACPPYTYCRRIQKNSK